MKNIYHTDIYKFDIPVSSYWEDTYNNNLNLEKLTKDLESAPNNFDILFKITDAHFANNNFDECFDVLLSHYPKNKEKIKSKILGYFDVLGFDHESTVLYRKKLSSIMFS